MNTLLHADLNMLNLSHWEQRKLLCDIQGDTTRGNVSFLHFSTFTIKASFLQTSADVQVHKLLLLSPIHLRYQKLVVVFFQNYTLLKTTSIKRCGRHCGVFFPFWLLPSPLALQTTRFFLHVWGRKPGKTKKKHIPLCTPDKTQQSPCCVIVCQSSRYIKIKQHQELRRVEISPASLQFVSCVLFKQSSLCRTFTFLCQICLYGSSAMVNHQDWLLWRLASLSNFLFLLFWTLFLFPHTFLRRRFGVKVGQLIALCVIGRTWLRLLRNLHRVLCYNVVSTSLSTHTHTHSHPQLREYLYL